MVGVGGFEPPTSRPRTVRSSLTELHPAVDRTPMLSDARSACRRRPLPARGLAAGGAAGIATSSMAERSHQCQTGASVATLLGTEKMIAALELSRRCHSLESRSSHTDLAPAVGSIRLPWQRADGVNVRGRCSRAAPRPRLGVRQAHMDAI